MRYSPSKRCFYPEWGDYSGVLPNDIVVVPDSDFDLVLNKPIGTKAIVENGRIKIVQERSEEEQKLINLEKSLSSIDREVEEENKKPFSYNGHSYIPDTEFIQAMYSVLSDLPDNFTEIWKTADKMPDGINNVYVSLDKEGIRGLALAYLQFKKLNWLVGDNKKKALKSTYLGV